LLIRGPKFSSSAIEPFLDLVGGVLTLFFRIACLPVLGPGAASGFTVLLTRILVSFV
jgi:hypothetical protein